MIELVCKACKVSKPFPAEYITSYKRGSTSPRCAACRIERSTYLKNRRKGKQKPATSRGWKDTMNHFLNTTVRKK